MVAGIGEEGGEVLDVLVCNPRREEGKKGERPAQWACHIRITFVCVCVRLCVCMSGQVGPWAVVGT